MADEVQLSVTERRDCFMSTVEVSYGTCNFYNMFQRALAQAVLSEGIEHRIFVGSYNSHLLRKPCHRMEMTIIHLLAPHAKSLLFTLIEEIVRDGFWHSSQQAGRGWQTRELQWVVQLGASLR